MQRFLSEFHGDITSPLRPALFGWEISPQTTTTPGDPKKRRGATEGKGLRLEVNEHSFLQQTSVWGTRSFVQAWGTWFKSGWSKNPGLKMV